MQILKSLRSIFPSLSRLSYSSALAIGLPVIAFTSFSEASPAMVATESPNQVTMPQIKPFEVANFFDIFRQVEEAVETINTVDSVIERIRGSQNSSGQSSNENTQVVLPSSQDRQVLLRDESPSRCQVVSEGENSGNCNSFEMTQTGELLIFTYYFDDAPVSFLALAEPMQREEFTTSHAFGQMQIEDESIETVGSCVVGQMAYQYRIVHCTTEDDIEFSYERL